MWHPRMASISPPERWRRDTKDYVSVLHLFHEIGLRYNAAGSIHSAFDGINSVHFSVWLAIRFPNETRYTDWSIGSYERWDNLVPTWQAIKTRRPEG